MQHLTSLVMHYCHHFNLAFCNNTHSGTLAAASALIPFQNCAVKLTDVSALWIHAPGSSHESALVCHMSSICQAFYDFIVVQDSANLALQVSVLLVGPRGSGRSTGVRAATAALGIHMVPFSCHDLKGQTDSQTATALKASLEAAQEFAPVVLLLRHFEVLSESPQGASQGD